MCCFRLFKKRKSATKNGKNIKTELLPEYTCKSEDFPSDVKPKKSVKKPGLAPMTDTDGLYQRRSIRVEDLHLRKPNLTRKEAIALDIKTRKQRIIDAQLALGLTPNDVMAERLLQRDRAVNLETSSSQVSSKVGDIGYIIPAVKPKPKKVGGKIEGSDDTVYRKAKVSSPTTALGGVLPIAAAKSQTQATPANSDASPAAGKDKADGVQATQRENDDPEELRSDDEELPDENNWMYHPKEVQAVQDILHTADGDASWAIGNVDEEIRRKLDFDAYLSLAEMEADQDMEDHVFSCHALRYGTFITATQAMPTQQEREEAKKKKKITRIGLCAIVAEGHKDIKQFAVDYPIEETPCSSDSETDAPQNWIQQKKDKTKVMTREKPSRRKQRSVEKTKDTARTITRTKATVDEEVSKKES